MSDSEQAYEYGIAKVWTPEWGGHTEYMQCSSEQDARARVDYWQRGQQRTPSERLADMYVVRRPTGAWERVDSAVAR